MKEQVINRLGNSFGPAAITAGWFLVICGTVISILFSLQGIIICLIGAFLAFTFSSTSIDFDNRKIKSSNLIMGLFKTGKWMEVNSDMHFKLKKHSRNFRTYSRSNRSVDVKLNEYRLILFDSKNNELLPVKRSKNIKRLEKEAEQIATRLNIKFKK